MVAQNQTTPAHLSPEQDYVLYLIKSIFSLFSLLGCVFMLVVVLTLKRLKKTKNTFTFGLALSKMVPYTLMFTTACVQLTNPGDPKTLCRVEAAFIQYFLPVSWLYTACISLVMWMRIRGVPADTFPRVAKVLHAVCWIIPFIIELVVVIRELRDAASYDWCWLSNNGEAGDITVHSLKILLYFFVPLAVFYIINLGIVSFAYYTARRDFLNNSEELSSLITNSMKTKVKCQMDKLMSYPLVFLACYTFAVINRIYNYSHPGHPIFALAVLHSAMILDGFVTSLVFGMTKSIQRRLTKRFRRIPYMGVKLRETKR